MNSIHDLLSGELGHNPGATAARADSTSRPSRSLRLVDIALAAIGTTCGVRESSAPELRLLWQATESATSSGLSLEQLLHEVLDHPAPEDSGLCCLAQSLHLSPIETLAVALAAAVEEEALIGRLIAFVQTPVGGSRPTLGLLAQAFPLAQQHALNVLAELWNGPAVKSGLLVVLHESAPLPERPLQVPVALCMALRNRVGEMPGVRVGIEAGSDVSLPESVHATASQHARALAAGQQRTLTLQTGSQGEGRSAANAIALNLGKQPAFLEADPLPGLGPWLLLRGLLPVFCMELAPGERRRLREIPGYSGPVLVVTGPDGAVEPSAGATAVWKLPVPAPEERRDLWLEALSPGLSEAGETPALAQQLSSSYRHGAGRIAHLGRLAQHHAALADRTTPTQRDVLSAAWTGEGGGLDALAHPLRTTVSDEALVLSPALRTQLDTLLLRCRMREELTDGLGASAQTRYKPGVRALFTGPSGTGKTLAADWIATKLELPLYRVDLASVSSKYIGETEKNLSQLLARAEQAEVILLFDEADSLFGKRTDINDSNDRFANAQTNYLLQRIENYDGIVLLTSNSQMRFDEAFARRLDFVIEFPLPGPEERRGLWRSHLGPNSTIGTAELNRLAVLLDLSGGHIRNAVLLAAVRARSEARPLAYEDLLMGLEAELRKLGRQVPLELRTQR